MCEDVFMQNVRERTPGFEEDMFNEPNETEHCDSKKFLGHTVLLVYISDLVSVEQLPVVGCRPYDELVWDTGDNRQGESVNYWERNVSK